MKTVYKYKEKTGGWVILAVDDSDAVQREYLSTISAQVVNTMEYDFGPGVDSVGPHNTQLDSAGNVIRFVAPYAYMLDGERVLVRSLADHDATPPGVVICDPLDTMKEQKKTEIQDEKKRVRDGGVLVDGVLFDTDMAARMSYQEFGMMLAQNPAYSVDCWRASPGAFTIMDAAKYTAVLAAGETRMQSAYTWQKAQESAIDKAQTAGEVLAVNIIFK